LPDPRIEAQATQEAKDKPYRQALAQSLKELQHGAPLTYLSRILREYRAKQHVQLNIHTEQERYNAACQALTGANLYLHHIFWELSKLWIDRNDKQRPRKSRKVGEEDRRLPKKFTIHQLSEKIGRSKTRQSFHAELLLGRHLIGPLIKDHGLAFLCLYPSSMQTRIPAVIRGMGRLLQAEFLNKIKGSNKYSWLESFRQQVENQVAHMLRREPLPDEVTPFERGGWPATCETAQDIINWIHQVPVAVP